MNIDGKNRRETELLNICIWSSFGCEADVRTEIVQCLYNGTKKREIKKSHYLSDYYTHTYACMRFTRYHTCWVILAFASRTDLRFTNLSLSFSLSFSLSLSLSLSFSFSLSLSIFFVTGCDTKSDINLKQPVAYALYRAVQ